MYTPPYLEGWRGLIERNNGLLHEIALTLLADSNLTYDIFWPYAYFLCPYFKSINKSINQ